MSKRILNEIRDLTGNQCSCCKTGVIGEYFLVPVISLAAEKTQDYFNQRGDKCGEIARGQFSKITETACLSGWEFEADKSRYGVYVTRH